MKNKQKFSWLVLAITSIALLLNACRAEGPRTIDPEFSKYIAAFTFGSVSSSSSIQIELTQDMPAVELNQEIDQDLFEFSPKIKGKAYWTSSRTIRFVPEAGELQRGKTYDVWFKLGDIVKVDSKYKEFYFYFNVPPQNFDVEVLPYSPMKDNDATWNTVQARLTLADEAPIDQIQQMFSVSGAAAPKIKVEPSDIKGRYKVSIDSLKRTKDQVDYTLIVSGKPIGAEKEDKATITIPPLGINPFTIIDARVDRDPSEYIRISFSDPLSANQNIQGLVNLNGVENFSYDIQKNVLKLYLEANNSLTSVNVGILKQLKSIDNYTLDKDYSYSLSIEKNKPEVKLLNSGNILPNSDQLNIPFQAVNLWAVDVSIVKIYDNNILGYLQSNDVGGNSELRRFGRLILKKHIRLDEDRSMRLDRWNNFSIDLSKLIKQDPGAMYRVQFTIKKEYSLYPCAGIVPQIPEDAGVQRFQQITEEEEAVWDKPDTDYYDETNWYGYNWEEREDPCKDSYYADKKFDCIVFASNIGIISKIGSDKKVLVTLTDILTTKPISGATVDVYNFQMQRIGSGKSDGDGFASIEYQGSVPFAVVVTNDKEKGYLKLTSNQSLSLSQFDVSGREIQKGLKGYIYGERGVWRPGDSIYLTFILEDKDKILPKNHPVSLEFFSPTGQLYQRLMQTEGKDG
ncbi:MAG: hypothetical protein RL662_1956, partial [Bacteroidota bacterium]